MPCCLEKLTGSLFVIDQSVIKLQDWLLRLKVNPSKNANNKVFLNITISFDQRKKMMFREAYYL